MSSFLFLFFTEKTSMLVSFSTLSTFFFKFAYCLKMVLYKQFVQVFPNAGHFSFFYFMLNRAIVLMSRVFPNGPGNQGSILGRVIPKTQKIVLDVALLNTQHHKVSIKGKVEQSRERSSALSFTPV